MHLRGRLFPRRSRAIRDIGRDLQCGGSGLGAGMSHLRGLRDRGSLQGVSVCRMCLSKSHNHKLYLPVDDNTHPSNLFPPSTLPLLTLTLYVS